MRSNQTQFARHYLLLALAAGVVFCFNLGTPRLWDRDEPRNAGCAAEMLARGDWVVPVFNGQLRVAKPALLYWLMMASYSVLGTNELAARLPSALLAIGTVLATYHIGRRLFGPTAALWSGLVLATSLMFDVAARAATPDSTLIFFSTLGLAIFVLGVVPARTTPTGPNDFARRVVPLRVAVPLYAALGLAVLAKGPVGALLPMAVIGMFLLVARLQVASDERPVVTWLGRAGRLALSIVRPFAPANFADACWQMRLATALATILVVALPWYVWVGVRTDGAWLEGFLLNDNVRRFMEPLEDHRGSIFYYPMAILLGFFPWSVWALPVTIEAATRIRRRDSRAASYLFCACWAGVYVGLFSLAQTKLPSYVTPCYPALALLAGAFVERWLARSLLAAAWWPQVSQGVLAAVGAALLVALPIAAHKLLPGEEWLGAVALVPLAGGVAALVLTRRSQLRAAGVTLAATAIVLQAVFFGVVLVRVDRQQQCQLLFEAAFERSEQPRLAAFGCLESSWVYYAGRPIEQFGYGGERAPTLPPPPGESSELRKTELREFAAAEGAYVITTEKLLPALLEHLPADTRVLAEAPYFLKPEKLVIVGRDAANAQKVGLSHGERRR